MTSSIAKVSRKLDDYVNHHIQVCKFIIGSSEETKLLDIFMKKNIMTSRFSNNIKSLHEFTKECKWFTFCKRGIPYFCIHENFTRSVILLKSEYYVYNFFTLY